MKKILPFVVALGFNMIMSADQVFAGSEGGGGGDAQEARVNEIRSDILKWINEGGARGLKLSVPVEYYEEEMKKILQNKEVALSFTEDRVQVEGKEKTCRGYFENNKPQMLCNIKRFEGTPASDQYRLIHHEYAGLVSLERNEGAASDYEISKQITDFLREEKVLRLATKEPREKITFKPEGENKYRLVSDLGGSEECPKYLMTRVYEKEIYISHPLPTLRWYSLSVGNMIWRETGVSSHGQKTTSVVEKNNKEVQYLSFGIDYYFNQGDNTIERTFAESVLEYKEFYTLVFNKKTGLLTYIKQSEDIMYQAKEQGGRITSKTSMQSCQMEITNYIPSDYGL